MTMIHVGDWSDAAATVRWRSVGWDLRLPDWAVTGL